MLGITEYFRRSPLDRPGKPPVWSFALAGLIVAVLYTIHLAYCQQSPLKFMDAIFLNSDMHTDLLWAEGVRQQGWLNPSPYHTWNSALESVAPFPQWIQWWGGDKVFEKSPLYVYMLSVFIGNVFLMRVLQAVMSIGTCVFIGLLTARTAGRTAGWIAFWLAALYAPFYAYTWPFLRDGLGWFLTAALLWALSELTHAEWSSARANRFAWLAGIILGLGFLARETYSLAIPVVCLGLAALAWKRQHWSIVLRVGVATVLMLSPLVIRNYLVGAPLLSSSNRLPETFVWGNAAGVQPYVSVFVPEGSRRILYASGGKTFPLIAATVASYPDGIVGFLKLQGQKFLTLFDPYELPDNLSFYFVASISPVVRLGLRYWMILSPGLVGIALSIWKRQYAFGWIWILLPVFGFGLFVGLPVSRYRQSLMIFLIPGAAYFFVLLWEFLFRREFMKVVYGVIALLAGWVLVLGPLSRQPRNQYERPQEYLISAEIFHRLGDDQKAESMLAFVHQKFPGFQF